MKKLFITSALLAGMIGASSVYAQSADKGTTTDRGTNTNTRGTTERGADRGVGEVIDDATITARVKARFAGDGQVSAMRITIETRNGVVQLAGFAVSEAEKTRAGELARGVSGVKQVHNDIIVRGSETGDKSSGKSGAATSGTRSGSDTSRSTGGSGTSGATGGGTSGTSGTGGTSGYGGSGSGTSGAGTSGSGTSGTGGSR